MQGRASYYPSSELCMEAASENRNQSPVGIVCGIDNQLIIEGERYPFVEAVGIIGFEDLLRSIVELAIADQDAETARCEVCARLG